MFTAEKGKGAFLNGKRIKVSDRAYPHCMIAFGGSWSVGKEPLVKENFPRLFEKFYHRFKVIGSAVYAEACVAAGILDAYPCFMENPWDVASGILLVQEAGGTVTDIYGNPPTPYQKHYIFSNKPLHEEVRRTLKV
jgi:myo-inositol-1(or 4)-monophosphatase